MVKKLAALMSGAALLITLLISCISFGIVAMGILLLMKLLVKLEESNPLGFKETTRAGFKQKVDETDAFVKGFKKDSSKIFTKEKEDDFFDFLEEE